MCRPHRASQPSPLRVQRPLRPRRPPTPLTLSCQQSPGVPQAPDEAPQAWRHAPQVPEPPAPVQEVLVFPDCSRQPFVLNNQMRSQNEPVIE
jgi:hypothetical protein